MRKTPLSKQEIQRRHRKKKKELYQAIAKERDFFKEMAQNLQDRNRALENTSNLQRQKIDSLKSQLQIAHKTIAARESRPKQSKETAWVIDQIQAAPSLQQQIEFSGSQRQGAQNAIAAIRESEKTNESGHRCLEYGSGVATREERPIQQSMAQENTVLKRQNTQLLKELQTDKQFINARWLSQKGNYH
jgi:hypothetical protein